MSLNYKRRVADVDYSLCVEAVAFSFFLILTLLSFIAKLSRIRWWNDV